MTRKCIPLEGQKVMDKRGSWRFEILLGIFRTRLNEVQEGWGISLYSKFHQCSALYIFYHSVKTVNGHVYCQMHTKKKKAVHLYEQKIKCLQRTACLSMAFRGFPYFCELFL